jgi:hypothetical protein
LQEIRYLHPGLLSISEPIAADRQTVSLVRAIAIVSQQQTSWGATNRGT